MLLILVATVAALGVIVPRLIEWLLVARAVDRGLGQARKASDVDLSRVAAYHQAGNGRSDPDTVDNATWSDLNFDAMFLSVDQTASQIGRQYLYDLLRRPQFALHPLKQLEAAIRRFSDTPTDSARAREILRPLDDPRAGYFTDLLYGELPGRPTLWWVFPVLTATACACLALIFVWPKAAVVWLVVCIANIAIQLIWRPRLRRLIIAFQSIPTFVGAAERLSGLSPIGIECEHATLIKDTPKLASLRRSTKWLLFEPGAANELASSIYEYINILFLLDVNAFVFCITRVQTARPVLRRVFAAIGRIDTAQSIAQWRHSLPHWTTPDFSAVGKTLRTTEVFHPLLTVPVANSLSVGGVSVLITGSNMAGKTTFMRTLGVNAILAQTLHTVCAHSWVAPVLHVRSSIGRTDSLLDGKSHYLAEVESVRSLLYAKRPDRQHLFLLDEMFRGTNTAERVAAAYAVLAYLTQGIDIVLVATHDLELVELLGDAYETYHFRERVEDGTLFFDYRLRAGASSTRNAIALLQAKQYPEEIIANAMAVLNRAQVPAAPQA